MSKSRAVTLAESVLAIFLLALTIVLVFNLYTRSMATLRVSAQKIQADAIAQSILEDQMTEKFADLAVGTKVLPKVPGKGCQFEPTLEILDMTEPPGVDTAMIKRMRVTIRWKDRHTDHILVREMARANVKR